MIPVGQLTLFMGEPGIGKSLVAMVAIARLTRSQRGLTGRDSGTPWDAFLFAAEDDVGTPVRPRLDSAGADADRVSVVQNYATHPNKRVCNDRPQLDEELVVEMLW